MQVRLPEFPGHGSSPHVSLGDRCKPAPPCPPSREPVSESRFSSGPRPAPGSPAAQQVGQGVVARRSGPASSQQPAARHPTPLVSAPLLPMALAGGWAALLRPARALSASAVQGLRSVSSGCLQHAVHAAALTCGSFHPLGAPTHSAPLGPPPLPTAPQLSTLVLAEHKGGALQPNTLHVLTAARALGGPVTVLVAGHGIGPVAEAAAKAEGVSGVLTADDPCLAHGLAEPAAALLATVEQRCVVEVWWSGGWAGQAGACCHCMPASGHRG